ncbi:hypothetical protein ACLKA7_007376 [Drosophila subpalustris]
MDNYTEMYLDESDGEKTPSELNDDRENMPLSDYLGPNRNSRKNENNGCNGRNQPIFFGEAIRLGYPVAGQDFSKFAQFKAIKSYVKTADGNPHDVIGVLNVQMAYKESHPECPKCSQDLEPGSFKVVVGNCSPSARKQLMAAAANHQPVTRNLTKALEQASAPAQSASLEPNAANMPNNSHEALEISNSTNQSEAVAPHPPANRRRGRPSHSANNRRNNGPDYASIQNMIEQTVTRVLSSLTIRPPSNHDEVVAQPLASRPESHPECPKCSQDLEPGSFKVVVGNCSPSARKQLMAAAANHQPVTRNLTKALEQASAPAQSASLEPNAANMPNNSHEALEISNSTNQSEAVAPHPPANRRRGRPSHSANNRRNNGPDYASIQNMIEQTVTRVLSSLTIRPPSNHDEVVAQPLASRPVGHLRRLVQMNENLIGELRSCADVSSKPKPSVPRHQVYAMEDTYSDTESIASAETTAELAAIRQAGPNVKCWNCEELGIMIGVVTRQFRFWILRSKVCWIRELM